MEYSKNRGSFDPFTISILGFLVVSLSLGALAVIRNSSFDIRQRAQSYSCEQECLMDPSHSGWLPDDCEQLCQQPSPLYRRCRNNACVQTTDSSGTACQQNLECLPLSNGSSCSSNSQCSSNLCLNSICKNPLCPTNCAGGCVANTSDLDSNGNYKCATVTSVCAVSQGYQCNGNNSEYCSEVGNPPSSSIYCVLGCSESGKCITAASCPADCPGGCTDENVCTTAYCSSNRLNDCASKNQSCVKNFVGGFCTNKLTNGTACTDGSDCTSGFCESASGTANKTCVPPEAVAIPPIDTAKSTDLTESECRELSGCFVPGSVVDTCVFNGAANGGLQCCQGTFKPNGQYCSGADKNCQVEGTKQCLGGDIAICTSGFWRIYQSCQSGGSCSTFEGEPKCYLDSSFNYYCPSQGWQCINAATTNYSGYCPVLNQPPVSYSECDQGCAQGQCVHACDTTKCPKGCYSNGICIPTCNEATELECQNKGMYCVATISGGRCDTEAPACTTSGWKCLNDNISQYCSSSGTSYVKDCDAYGEQAFGTDLSCLTSTGICQLAATCPAKCIKGCYSDNSCKSYLDPVFAATCIPPLVAKASRTGGVCVSPEIQPLVSTSKCCTVNSSGIFTTVDEASLCQILGGTPGACEFEGCVNNPDSDVLDCSNQPIGQSCSCTGTGRPENSSSEDSMSSMTVGDDERVIGEDGICYQCQCNNWFGFHDEYNALHLNQSCPQRILSPIVTSSPAVDQQIAATLKYLQDLGIILNLSPAAYEDQATLLHQLLSLEASIKLIPQHLLSTSLEEIVLFGQATVNPAGWVQFGFSYQNGISLLGDDIDCKFDTGSLSFNTNPNLDCSSYLPVKSFTNELAHSMETKVIIKSTQCKNIHCTFQEAMANALINDVVIFDENGILDLQATQNAGGSASICVNASTSESEKRISECISDAVSVYVLNPDLAKDYPNTYEVMKTAFDGTEYEVVNGEVKKIVAEPGLTPDDTDPFDE